MTQKEGKKKNEQTLSTPVNILWENILMIPLFGVIDTKRAATSIFLFGGK